MKQIDLTGKRALVTGANSGIGAAIATALAGAGANVAINYVAKPDDAAQLVRDIQDGGGQATAIQADVTKPDQVEAMFTQIDESFGGLEILVNNAGIDGPRELSWEADLDHWRQVIEVNLFGALFCCRAALRRMVPKGAGVVLNMTSVHEVIPWSGYSAYSTSKAGLAMLTKTLSQEAGPHGVRVLALAPGAVRTPINQSVWQNPASFEDLKEKIPMGRIGDRSEVAEMATFLVSDLASYVTGTTVVVDGGMTNYASFSHGG